MPFGISLMPSCQPQLEIKPILSRQNPQSLQINLVKVVPPMIPTQKASLSVLSFQFMKPAKGKENTQSLKIWFMRLWTIFQGYIKKWSNKGTDPVADRRFRKTSKKWPDVSPANVKYGHK